MRAEGHEENGVRIATKRGVIRSLLYWAEWIGLKMDHRDICGNYRQREDAWLVAREDELHGPYRFSDVVGIALQGLAPFHVVHVSETERDPVPWFELDYVPLWSNPWVGRCQSIMGWGAVAVVALCLFWGGASFFRNSSLLPKPAQVAGRKSRPVAAGETPAATPSIPLLQTPQIATQNEPSKEENSSPQAPPDATPGPLSIGHLNPVSQAEANPVTRTVVPSPHPQNGAADIAGPTTVAEPAAVIPPVRSKEKSPSTPLQEMPLTREELAALQPQIKKIAIAGRATEYDGSLILIHSEPRPKGLVLLAADFKKAPESLLSHEWLEFAKTNHLAIGGVSFLPKKVRIPALPVDQVLAAIDAEFSPNIPLLIKGDGVGANAALCFAGRQPERVAAWFGSNINFKPGSQRAGQAGPGILLCAGGNDHQYKLCWDTFVAGRQDQRPWTWISALDLHEARSGRMQEFVRAYFEYALTSSQSTGDWYGNDSRKQVASDVAKSRPASASFLPSRSLLSPWVSLNTDPSRHLPEAKIIQCSIDTHVPAQPRLNLLLRLPPGATDGSSVTSVLAYCTWIREKGTLLDQLKTGASSLIDYADENNLAILTWNTATLWKSGVDFNDLSFYQQRQYDTEFDAVARAWDTGVSTLVKQAKIPGNDYLLYGISRGAHWGQRLALRKPNRFLAIHIHVANSYDKPTRAANKCLWLVTTGEIDCGYKAARQFYDDCLGLGYPIILKAGSNLGHSDSPEIRKISFAFFDYALAMMGRRNEVMREASKSLHPLSDDALMVWRKDFQEPPYFGDFLNQDVFPKNEAAMIPADQRIPLPTQDIAEAWGDVHD